MRNIIVTDIIRTGEYERGIIYSVCFKRGREDTSVELTPHGKVVEPYDATVDEVMQCKETLRAYLTLRRHGMFDENDDFIPTIRYRW